MTYQYAHQQVPDKDNTKPDQGKNGAKPGHNASSMEANHGKDIPTSFSNVIKENYHCDTECVKEIQGALNKKKCGNDTEPDQGKNRTKSDQNASNVEANHRKDIAKSSSNTNYQNNTCGKSYTNRTSLVYHLTVDCKKETMFVFSFCPYKYRRRSNLHRHMQLLHYHTRPRKNARGNGRKPDQGKNDPKRDQGEEKAKSDQSKNDTKTDQDKSDTKSYQGKSDTKLDRGKSDTKQDQSKNDTKPDHSASNVEANHGQDIVKSFSNTSYHSDTYGKSYTSRASLIYHRNMDSRKEPMFMCSFCPYKSRRRSSLYRHIQLLHYHTRPRKNAHDDDTKLDQGKNDSQPDQDKSYTKPYQGENDTKPDHSASNVKASHTKDIAKLFSNTNYYSDTCGKSYTSRASSIYHLTMNCRKEPRFVCSFCPYKSRRRSSLHRHMQLLHYHARPHKTAHVDDTPDQSKNDTKPDHSTNNVEANHGMNIAKFCSNTNYDCDTCGKPFTTWASLNYHRNVECRKEPKFVCSFCPYKFRKKINLRRHMQLLHYCTRPRKNARKDNTKSDQGKNDTKPDQSANNVEINSLKGIANSTSNAKEENYRCDSCGTTYMTSASLYYHQNVECRKPSLVCSFCPFKSRWGSSLRRHMSRVHSDAKLCQNGPKKFGGSNTKPDQGKNGKKPDQSKDDIKSDQSKNDTKPVQGKGDTNTDQVKNVTKSDHNKNDTKSNPSACTVVVNPGKNDKKLNQSKNDTIPDQGKSDGKPDQGRSDEKLNQYMSDTKPDHSANNVEANPGKDDTKLNQSKNDTIPDQGKNDTKPDQSKSDRKPNQYTNDTKTDHSANNVEANYGEDITKSVTNAIKKNYHCNIGHVEETQSTLNEKEGKNDTKPGYNASTEEVNHAKDIAKSSSNMGKQKYRCATCGKSYTNRASLVYHIHKDCGKKPKVVCSFCAYRCKWKNDLYRHIQLLHSHTRPRKNPCKDSTKLDQSKTDANQDEGKIVTKSNLGKNGMKPDQGKNDTKLDYNASNVELNRRKDIVKSSNAMKKNYHGDTERVEETQSTLNKKAGVDDTKSDSSTSYTNPDQGKNDIKLDHTASTGEASHGKNVAKSSSNMEKKKYQCNTCSQSYTNRASLVSHIYKDCEKEPMFVCSFCPYRTKWKNELYRHIQLLHSHTRPGEGDTNPDQSKNDTQSGHRASTVDANHGENIANSSSNTEKEYQCDTCGKSYTSRASIVYHIHNNCGMEPKFVCSFCPYRSKWKNELRKHIQQIHCHIRPREYPDGDGPSNVEGNHEEDVAKSSSDAMEKRYQCATCGKFFTFRRSLLHHIRQNCEKEPKIVCPFCPYKFRWKYELSSHIQLLHRHRRRSRKNPCKDSTKPNQNKSNRKPNRGKNNTKLDHSASNVKANRRKSVTKSSSNTVKKRYQCDTCGRSYKWRRTIVYHIRKECEKNRKRNTKSGRSGSIIEANRGDDDNYHCDTCGKYYTSQASYEYHRYVECNREPTFVCSICPYKSRRKTNLRRHMQVIHCHIGPRENKTKKRGNRKRNQGKNDTKQDHNASTVEPSNAEGIASSSSNTKKGNYRCDTCGIVCNTPASLFQHQNVECRKKPIFVCSMCPYKSRKSHNLTRHLYVMHRLKSYHMRPRRSTRTQN